MTVLLTALAIVVVAWFAAGSLVNVRRGRAALRWLQAGLPVLGARTTVRWLGSTAVQLVLSEPRLPFQEVTVIVFLEPRDVPWMWALSRRRGRRDLLIVRARLRRPPGIDLEAVDRRSWSGREVLHRLRGPEWSTGRTGGATLTVFHRPGHALALARADGLVARAAGTGVTVRRLSVRRDAPHLQLHLDLPGRRVPAEPLFRAVRELGERASH